MSKFMEAIKEDRTKTLMPNLKRMFWIVGVGFTSCLMFQMIGYWVDSMAIVVMQYLCYTVSALTAIAFYGTFLVWHMDRYSEYRKAR